MNRKLVELSELIGKTLSKIVRDDMAARDFFLVGDTAVSSEASAAALIEGMRGLAQGWDGYDAVPLSEDTLANAIRALRVALDQVPSPDITPNPNGTLSFEWESERGNAHLEIGKTRFSFYIQPSVGAPTLADGVAAAIDSSIGEELRSFLSPSTPSRNSMTILSLGNVRYPR